MPPATPAVLSAAPIVRNRLVAVLLGIGVALALLVTPALTPSASAARAPHTAATAKRFAADMLNLLNAERRVHHLRPLYMNARLIKSAHAHNLAMARANEMSHQVRGEQFFADRISRTGYRWRSVGENIGWNSRETSKGIYDLERQMYNEKAPNNGHRLNILSRSFRQVGIDVYFDAGHHKMWFTQDFGQHA
jgi:uncharacterized protein YkwD